MGNHDRERKNITASRESIRNIVKLLYACPMSLAHALESFRGRVWLPNQHFRYLAALFFRSNMTNGYRIVDAPCTAGARSTGLLQAKS